MNDMLKQRILRRLENLSDERGYQVLDYVEFLESKYAERQAPTGILAKITETVEDTMRAARLPAQAITGTVGFMDSAAKLMKGIAAAGQAAVEEAMKVAASPALGAPEKSETTATPSAQPAPTVPPDATKAM
ncbi:MAG: hypothetical protein ACOY71_04945 [Gemmatimonadota bacterium]